MVEVLFTWEMKNVAKPCSIPALSSGFCTSTAHRFELFGNSGNPSRLCSDLTKHSQSDYSAKGIKKKENALIVLSIDVSQTAD